MVETPTFTMRADPEHQPLLREVCRFVRTRPDGAVLVRKFLDESVSRRVTEIEAQGGRNLQALRYELADSTKQLADRVTKLEQENSGLEQLGKRVTDLEINRDTSRDAIRAIRGMETR